MSELISQWIQSRLGLVVNMSPENFAVKTADGRLLAEILFSYSLIALEQLNLITRSNYVSDCYNNFKHLKIWLSDLRVTLDNEDVYEIVRGLGTASLHLFYQVYLEFRNKSKLDIVMQHEIQSQLGTKQTRFEVTKTTSKPSNRCELNKDACTLALIGGDAYHWYRDRMESLQTRCKEARNEYIHTMIGLCKSGLESREYSLVLPQSPVETPRPSMRLNPLADSSVDNISYESLMEMQKTAKQIQPIVPDLNIATKIISDIKSRNLAKQENKIIRTEMHLEILNEFEKKLNENKAKHEDKVITDILLKQSNYEKLLMSKMAQVKIQKDFMLENKFIQGDKWNTIKEREFVNSLLVKEKDLNQNKLVYYMERDRLLQLHRRVWNERLRLRAKRHEELCAKVVHDLVDVSIRVSEYKKRFGQEMSKREMVDLKHLFLGEQPVIDFYEPVVRLIEDNSEDVEEAICKEITRQDVIDMEEFESYMNCEWPWELKNVPVTPEILHYVACGLNVLGHVVHQLLTAKYPEPPAPEVPRFPQAMVRVCVNGCNDINSIPILRNLLTNREIEVVQMAQAVNYCIEAFNSESKREYETDKQDNDNDTYKAKIKATKAPKKGEKSKGRVKLSNSELAEGASKEFDNKIVQTPIKFPWEEIDFSHQATLGKTGQDLLNAGEALTDFLLVAMFIEYLKSIPNLKGWVLINYPNNFEQAVILEQAFTGINILNMSQFENKKSILDITDLNVDEDNDACSLAQQQQHKRRSELLPIPYGIEPVVVYDTFLTAYIKLKPFPTDEQVSVDVSLPPCLEALEANPDLLDKFYSDTGVNYSMYYKDMDFVTIKHLAKLVIGDYSLPLKSSLELFGVMSDKGANEESRQGLRVTKIGEKVKKPKIKTEKSNTVNEVITDTEKESKGKKGAKKNLKVVIVHEDKSVQVPDDDEEFEEIFVKKESDVPAPKAGELGWEYVKLPIAEEYMISLASFWEVVEEIYINDMKQLFFLKRTKMNLIAPFAQYIKDAMELYIEKPDYKSYYLAKFQRAFNAFDLEYRKDNEFKAEMHCRIFDFQEKMFEICDEKMIMAENRRCEIIKANWAPKEISALVNDYISMMQIELDRFVESLWLIDKYFSGIFTNKPIAGDIFDDENLPKVTSIDAVAVNTNFEQRDSETNMSQFSDLFANMLQNALTITKRCLVNSQANYDKFKSMSESAKPKSKTTTPKSKDENTSMTTRIDSDLIKEKLPKILDEWQCAVKGEAERTSLRLELIKFNALESIGEFMRATCGAFHQIYDRIRNKYEKETENIRKVCQLFQTVVEQERPLQKELIFEGDTFYINPEVSLFENPLPVSDLPDEIAEENSFTISSLSKLVDILLDISPSGYIPKISFLYLMQDIICDSGAFQSELMGPPPLWKNLNSYGLKMVIDELFDELEYVYWKDFIVHNIRVPFPTENELILARRLLRKCDPDCTELVYNYQFYSTKLWFELMYKTSDSDKIQAIKRLLMKMYGVGNDQVNYTALLLDFCKDDNSIVGFAKALELSLGKMICWNWDDGEAFKNRHLKNVAEHNERVRLRDEEIKDRYKAVLEELEKIIDQIVRMEDGVVIEDVTNEQSEVRKSSILKRNLFNDDEKKRRSSKDEDVKFKEEHDIKYIEDNETPRISENVQTLPNNVDRESSNYSHMSFFLPLDNLINVITASLPWHSRVVYHEDLSFLEQVVLLHTKLTSPVFNMSVLCHEYLNNEEFLKLLALTKKFSSKNPVVIVKTVMEQQN